MADLLRVRAVPNRQNCWITPDGYVLFGCRYQHARVAVIRPNQQVPFAYCLTAAGAAAAIEAARPARGVR
ncbi:hypothetical protein SAMN05216288_4274 [Pseudomonas punonensis]|uniref:Uncharacterized protein n=1 Tax=Phytopseudomonas punonensis TaxID=1220495 RepID=A0A1M7LK10_9GAMM|nr:hypothetical protein SAMN05216288_4274 [Pseudomonas punonensis]